MHDNTNLPNLCNIQTCYPIEQSTDNLTNQTSFVVNLMNAHNLKQEVQVGSFSDVRCKYCKGFYFPEQKRNNRKESNLKGREVKGLTKNQGNTFLCGLCGAVNQTTLQQISDKFPRSQQFILWKTSQQNDSIFQSIILGVSNPAPVHNHSSHLIKSQLISQRNSIFFVFYIDLMSSLHELKHTVLTYLKTVIKEYFLAHVESSKSNPQVDINEEEQYDEKHNKCQQRYNILIFLNINDQLHLANLNTISTINMNFLLKQKNVSTIPTQNTPDMYEKQAQRKSSLIEMINGCGVDLREGGEKAEEYLEMVIDEVEQMSSRHAVNSSENWSELVELLAADKDVSRSYVTVWIGQVPLLNYEPHKVNKSNIYSIVYLFHEPSFLSHSTTQPLTQSLPQQFQHSNIRNQLTLIKDNHQTYFLPSSQQGLQQFYYKLYELFSIVEYPKMFRARWTIKSDSKYPPLLTNDFPSFFVTPSSVLLFVVSALVSGGNSNHRFQVAVGFEDWNRQEKVWLINWEKNGEKEIRQLNEIRHVIQHKQNHQCSVSPLISKLPQIYNYICTLSKFSSTVCMRGRTDLTPIQQKRTLFTSNTVTSHQLCVLFQSIINRGVFKSGTIQITISYIQSMYEYCTGVKNVPYEMVRFFANCQVNVKKAVQMVYPLLVRNHNEESSSFVLYWGEAYFCLNDHSEDQNSQDQDWYDQFIQTYNHSQGKYYTRRCYYQKHNHSDENQLLKFYLKKVHQNQQFKQQYLPIYFTDINQ